MKSGERPTGIIRTLPWYGAEDGKHDAAEKTKAYDRMLKGFRGLESGEGHILIALPSQPRFEVLHLYLLMDGQVRVRGNISHYLDGKRVGGVTCWDDSKRTAKVWAVVTGPVSWPSEEIRIRGFQGFRYTQALW